MICGNKQDIEKILPYVSEGLQKALQYIKETNFAEVNNGEYEICLLYTSDAADE